MEFLNNLLGLDIDKLTGYQMAARAIIVFFISLAYVRIAGVRTFGRTSSFDQITTLIFGTLMGNAVFTSRAPFFPLLLAALIIMLLHRLVAFLTFKSTWFGRIIKGEPLLLIQKGKLQSKNVNSSFISEHDLTESLRLNGSDDDLNKVEKCYLERSGEISFVKNKH